MIHIETEDFSRLEIMLDDKPFLFDAVGAGLKKKAMQYFGIQADSVRHVKVFSVDKPLDREVEQAFSQAITNPVTQKSSFEPLIGKEDMDWVLHVGYKPGVKDNPGEASATILSHLFEKMDANVFASQYFALKGNLTREQVEMLGRELKANDTVERFQVFSKDEWNPRVGVGRNIPKVTLDKAPEFAHIPLSDHTIEEINQISEDRNLYLNKSDIPTIVQYFTNPEVIQRRKELGLIGLTDVEIEFIGQSRSDHCCHNTFNGKFNYKEKGRKREINNLFAEFIKEPTERIKGLREDIVSVLWDNCGVMKFNDKFYITATSETHNSPSNMEAYGGAITGIVGVYRDPMGTGKSSKLILGAYGYCVGPNDYDGPLVTKLHPRRLTDGIIEGVRDGGNKSGVPTPFGFYFEEPENMFKSNVFVTALGLMPVEVPEKPAYEKSITPGDLIVMSGGRVGKDGIHGVTAASAGLDEGTPAGHVQIGDPYTQKKMHDFINEARDRGYFTFITDNGGGGLSSSVGESASFENSDGKTGAELWLDKVPTKYAGLDQWEILVSESQERMTIAVNPKYIDDFMELSRLHGVESTVIGEYNNSEALTIKYGDTISGYIPTEFLGEQFPQWEFDAEWISPEDRGLHEPVLDSLKGNYADSFKEFLKLPNVASKEWIARQYDHEVQGTSVIKPFVGKKRDIPADATVQRPDLDDEKGLVFTQSVIQKFGKIDTYHMTTASMDESIRSILAVGGDLDKISGMDNFCWPSIQKHEADASYKAAQLVRSSMALKDVGDAYEIPLLSGKDSMYIDATVKNKDTREHERHSGLGTLQYTAISTIDDVCKVISPDAKEEGSKIYVIGITKDELGGSEFYNMHGEVGLNVPITDIEYNKETYQRFSEARRFVNSAKAMKEGGVIFNLFEMATGGRLGARINLKNLITDDSVTTNEAALYSNSTGRFIVEVSPWNTEQFEEVMGDRASCIGEFTKEQDYVIRGINMEGSSGGRIMKAKMGSFIDAWKSTHGDR